MTRFFGTDGVRGVANRELSCEMAFALGCAAVELLGKRLVIGRDTRRSGPMLEAALVAGITSAGGDALLAGIIPTPAVALLVRELDANGGVVISASHNPPEYNGIKFFDARGFKLTREIEDAFEARLQGLAAGAVPDSPTGTPAATPPATPCAAEAMPGTPATPPVATPATPPANTPTGTSLNTPTDPQGSPPARPTGTAVGTVIALEDAGERYIAYAVETVRGQGLDLTGLHIAVDCGHGASFATTPEALRRLGATVTAINTDFNGNDINVGCGSTHLERLRALVTEVGADLGIAHDGDADRVLALDELGNELDGDFIEAICALDLKERGRLTHLTVVTTVMCNLGFIRAMQGQGIEVVQTAVGDSNVLAALREGGYVIGGEQSGHLIFLEHNSTGDGLVAALQLLAALRRKAVPLGNLARVMTRYPQALINVEVSDQAGFASSEAIAQAAREAEKRLGDAGRVLLRSSGTEPLIRVMVEADEEHIAQSEATRLASVVARELG